MKSTTLKIIFTSVLLSIVFTGKSFANSFTTQDAISSSLNASTSSNYSSSDTRRKIRLGFTAPSTMHRQLLLTEDENATSGIDWGYDGEYYATNYDDMYWLIEGQLFTIQGTDNLDELSSFPMGFHTYDDGVVSIGIDALENISDEFNLYLYDKELDIYHNLREGLYEFYAEAGEYLNRFQLTLQEPQASLSVEENELENFKIYYNSSSNTLTLKNLSNIILKGLSIYNMAGQLVYNYSLNETSSKQEIRLNNQPAKGTYIVLINTERATISKKTVFY